MKGPNEWMDAGWLVEMSCVVECSLAGSLARSLLAMADNREHSANSSRNLARPSPFGAALDSTRSPGPRTCELDFKPLPVAPAAS